MALFTVWKSKLLMPVAININIDANLPNAEVNYKIYSETSTQTLHTCLIIQSSTLSNQQYKHNENVFLSVLDIPSKFWVNAMSFKYIKMQSDEFYSSNIWIISSNKGI